MFAVISTAGEEVNLRRGREERGEREERGGRGEKGRGEKKGREVRGERERGKEGRGGRGERGKEGREGRGEREERGRERGIVYNPHTTNFNSLFPELWVPELGGWSPEYFHVLGCHGDDL